jgi:hypothetical protein
MYVSDVGIPFLFTLSDRAGLVTSLAGYTIKQAVIAFDDGTSTVTKDMGFTTDGSNMEVSFALTSAEQGANTTKTATIQLAFGNGSSIDFRVDGGKELLRARI